jgi:signal transduction histidine kinase
VKSYSLLGRITISLSVTMLLAAACSYGWLYLKARSTEIALREESLLDQAKVITGYLVVNSSGVFELDLPPRLAEAYSSPRASFRYAVRDERGQLMFTSGLSVAPLPALTKYLHQHYDYDPDGPGPLHIYGAAVESTIGGKSFFTQVEQQTSDSDYLNESVFEEFLTDGMWLQIPFLLIVLGVSVFIVKRALGPLTRVSKLAESISPGNADVRLPMADMPREVLPLVCAMNSALDRLDHGLKRQREFNANAAHQLRTPLAVLMANIDTLGDTAIAGKLRTDVEHMSRIVSQLLLIARLESLSIKLDEVVELNSTAAEIAAGLAPLALASSKTIELIRSDQSIFLRSSAFALREALGNLIENAISHTPAGTTVRLRVTNEPAIEVIDSGPGVPADQRVRIFERFWRSDQSKGGAGLGLAIVDRIMKALHGSVTVGDGPEGGALFALHFARDEMVATGNAIEA